MINKQTIGKAIKNTLGVTASVAIMVLPYLPLDKIVKTVKSNGSVTYGDTINAITSSYMSSSYMSEIIPLIPTNESSDFYKAIIAVVNSNMPSSYIRDTVIKLCKEESKESE